MTISTDLVYDVLRRHEPEVYARIAHVLPGCHANMIGWSGSLVSSWRLSTLSSQSGHSAQ